MATSSLWQIDADLAGLARAEQAWSRLSGALTGVATNGLERPARDLVRDWAGDTADAYRDNARGLIGRMETASGLAKQAAGLVGQIRYSVAAAQMQLDASFARAATAAPYTTDNGAVTFHPGSQQAGEVVEVEISVAQQIRARYSAQIVPIATALARLRGEFEALAKAGDADGAAGGRFATLVAEQSGTSVLKAGGQVFINTGTGNDKVYVITDRGKLMADVNGVTYPVDGNELTIRTGPGNNEVVVGPDVRVQVTLIGGPGNDHLVGGDTTFGLAGDDTIDVSREDVTRGDTYVSAGPGNNFVSGGAGADTIRGGRDSNNVFYGLGGNDILVGGQGGRNYLDGGEGNDQFFGGDKNVFAGGRGADRFYDGAGDTVAIGGEGTDTGALGSGRNTAYVQRDDSVADAKVVNVEYNATAGSTLDIVGRKDFIALVNSDLETMRGLPGAQDLLAGLDQPHDGTPLPNSLGVKEYLGQGVQVREVAPTPDAYDTTFAATPGGYTRISYAPADVQLYGDFTEPVSGLYHEFVHVRLAQPDMVAQGYPQGYTVEYGGSSSPVVVSNDERAAIGLPIAPVNDIYGQKTNYPVPGESENDLRDQLQIPKRETYLPNHD